ncbi:family 16 glycosylhydrolase [Nocardioides sp. MH1]|uniref:glycoside hydrolase family 16 protein n=1 Tax=Nocardioides sp. MH1 TaxID=3242490 RepID=UPI00351FB860
MTSRVRRLLVAGIAVGAVVAVVLAILVVSRSGSDDDGGPGSADQGDACGALLAKPGGGTWTCTFVDEFDGDALDPDKWTTQDTARTGFRSDQTCYRGAENVAVQDGDLVLEARDAGAEIDCDGPYGEFRTRYTGGLVGTRDHFSQTYGRFEVRAKFPTARTPGVHGGFWMYPVRLTYGRWPASGEIDVAEWWSNDPTLLLPTLHYRGRSFHADSGWHCRVDDPSEFHTYAVEWFPAVIRFAIDGTVCYTRTWRPTPPQALPQPFDKPFGMILNMGVGTVGGTNPVSGTTPLPATLTVDYAKAWR